MYHFPNEVNWTRFFRFDKKWIENMNWARLSTAAKAVLPVIACHCNAQGVSFPGEETIAAMSGLTAKTARKGINDLEGYPGYTWANYLTMRGKRGKKFSIKFPSTNEKGRSFFFHRGIIDGGIWSELTPSAKALYPVMRYFSRYDVYEDEDVDDMSDISTYYSQRKWELCDAENGQLDKYAGINRHTVSEAANNLKHNFLIEPYVTEMDEKTTKVFLIPKKYWKASYLNEKLKSVAIS